MSKKNKKSKKKNEKLLKDSVKKSHSNKKDKQKSKKKKSPKILKTTNVPTVSQVSSSTQETPSSEVIEQTFNEITQWTELLDSLYNAPIVFKDETVFPAEITALKQIKLDEPTNINTLAGHLGISRSAALKTANKLTFKGLLTKDINPETKAISLTVNEDGEAVLKQIPSYLEKNKERIIKTLEKFSSETLREFNSVLSQIIKDSEA